MWLLSEHRGHSGLAGSGRQLVLLEGGKEWTWECRAQGHIRPGALDKLPSPAAWGLTGLWFRGLWFRTTWGHCNKGRLLAPSWDFLTLQPSPQGSALFVPCAALYKLMSLFAAPNPGPPRDSGSWLLIEPGNKQSPRPWPNCPCCGHFQAGGLKSIQLLVPRFPHFLEGCGG